MHRATRTVVFWQREPYDAFAGGDGLYLDQLKKFMIRSGWDVITLTSNFGRPRIYLEPKYTYENYRRIVRGTVRLGKRHYFGPEALAVARPPPEVQGAQMDEGASAGLGTELDREMLRRGGRRRVPVGV
jgi:hypothetical protein